MFGNAAENGIIGFPVDAERFFTEQMAAAGDDIAVNLLMQIVRHRAVDGLDFGVGQQLLVIVRDLFDGREVVAIPVVKRRILVADRHQFRLGGHFGKVAPAGGRAGEFPAHQTGADDSEFYGFHPIFNPFPYSANFSRAALFRFPRWLPR
ncbi:hypothetical protein SDC9_183489 [bioreactor metagenome]|uniref:Uncharacterized protein n=1 Tax=bioreactor metagenome TaxID=1076179 RepID=A0A645HIN5_9ZZZZ